MPREIDTTQPLTAPPAKQGRLSALTDHVAKLLAAQARPAVFQPAVLRWA